MPEVIKKQIEELPKTSRTPFLTECRKMIKEGYNPETRLEMYRGEIMCLACNIGEGAKWTVKEEPTVHFEKYREPKGLEGR